MGKLFGDTALGRVEDFMADTHDRIKNMQDQSFMQRYNYFMAQASGDSETAARIWDEFTLAEKTMMNEYHTGIDNWDGPSLANGEIIDSRDIYDMAAGNYLDHLKNPDSIKVRRQLSPENSNRSDYLQAQLLGDEKSAKMAWELLSDKDKKAFEENKIGIDNYLGKRLEIGEEGITAELMSEARDMSDKYAVVAEPWQFVQDKDAVQAQDDIDKAEEAAKAREAYIYAAMTGRSLADDMNPEPDNVKLFDLSAQPENMNYMHPIDIKGIEDKLPPKADPVQAAWDALSDEDKAMFEAAHLGIDNYEGIKIDIPEDPNKPGFGPVNMIFQIFDKDGQKAMIEDAMALAHDIAGKGDDFYKDMLPNWEEVLGPDFDIREAIKEIVNDAPTVEGEGDDIEGPEEPGEEDEGPEEPGDEEEPKNDSPETPGDQNPGMPGGWGMPGGQQGPSWGMPMVPIYVPFTPWIYGPNFTPGMLPPMPVGMYPFTPGQGYAPGETYPGFDPGNTFPKDFDPSQILPNPAPGLDPNQILPEGVDPNNPVPGFGPDQVLPEGFDPSQLLPEGVNPDNPLPGFDPSQILPEGVVPNDPMPGFDPSKPLPEGFDPSQLVPEGVERDPAGNIDHAVLTLLEQGVADGRIEIKVNDPSILDELEGAKGLEGLTDAEEEASLESDDGPDFG